LVTEIEGTQTRAIFGGAVPIEVTVSLVSEMENKHIGTLLRLKDKYQLTQKHLHQNPRNQLYSKQTQ
jgi:hypothetical protein